MPFCSSNSISTAAAVALVLTLRYLHAEPEARLVKPCSSRQGDLASWVAMLHCRHQQPQCRTKPPA